MEYGICRINLPVAGIRSDTMSLVTVWSPLVMLRKATNSVTLLPDPNKTAAVVPQRV